MRCYATETMTCVGRYFGLALRLDGKAFHYAAYRDGLTEDLYITVGWADPAETGDLAQYLQLQLDSGTVPFTAMEGWDTPVCRIPWDTDPDRIFAARKNGWVTLTNGGIETESIRIYQRRFSVLPVFSMEAVLYAGYTHNLWWTLVPGEDRVGWVTGLQLCHRLPGTDAFTEETVYADAKLTEARLTLGEEMLGREVSLTAEYRTYAADWDGQDPEDFVTLNRYALPAQLVERSASVPLAPAEVQTTLPLDGGRITVSWPVAEDPVNTIASYTLEREVQGQDGGLSGYVRLYSGASLQFRDTLPKGLAAVRYRVCSINDAGTASPWRETGLLTIARSNIYVGTGGRWIRAAAVQVGGRSASPMVSVGGKQ
ncbi:MAG: hypothetical protein IKY52_01525 [Clostridia bacterium]|nr:hypothetical protein [Clostridia bacterium]